MQIRPTRGHARTGWQTPTPHIPKVGRRAFLVARANADRRGVEWQLTIHEWWEWWQQDGRWANRGRSSSQLVMARAGDIGPYALGNIYCATFRKNREDTGMRVETPLGVFDNAAAAAAASGVKSKTASDYASKEKYGWRYLRN